MPTPRFVRGRCTAFLRSVSHRAQSKGPLRSTQSNQPHGGEIDISGLSGRHIFVSTRTRSAEHRTCRRREVSDRSSSGSRNVWTALQDLAKTSQPGCHLNASLPVTGREKLQGAAGDVGHAHRGASTKATVKILLKAPSQVGGTHKRPCTATQAISPMSTALEPGQLTPEKALALPGPPCSANDPIKP